LFLILEGRDSQAMDLLANPNAIVVSLRRRVRFFKRTCTSAEEVAWNEKVEDMGAATWWPSAAHDVHSTETTRHLEGEIRLTKDMRPTSEMGHFSISVSTEPHFRFEPAFFVHTPSFTSIITISGGRCKDNKQRSLLDCKSYEADVWIRSIQYAVVLSPFRAVGFMSDSAALLSEPVEIATMHSKGPRMTAYAPPAYDPEL